jgi:four helix bundle protein
VIRFEKNISLILMRESILKDKSYQFALRIIKLYKFLATDKKEYVLSKQILRSGTSIGANIEESAHGESKKDFIHKLSIAQKEANETHYWLRLLHDSNFIDEKSFKSMLTDCEEILKLTTASIKTAKKDVRG